MKLTYQTNESQDTYFIEEEEFTDKILVSKRYYGPFKMFSEHDLEHMMHLQQKFKSK